MSRKREIQTSFAFDAPVSAKSRTPGSTKARTTAGRSAQRRRQEADELNQGELPIDAVPGEEARCRLERRLAAHITGTLDLVITDNRYSIITVRREARHYRVRAHHMFLRADSKVVRALARYVQKNDGTASQVLNEFIDKNQDKIKSSPVRARRKPVLCTEGRFYDLQEIFDDLNRRYFEGALDITITWGRKTRKRARRHRSIKMGSYSVEDKLIRIHPALDRSFVPRYFIESVVYHEMLHHIHPIPVKGGRRQFHTAEFKEQEKRFHQYQKAKRWERANIDRLLFF
jgi:predicted metal-dependent hydrolase